ncbi:DUF4255 domain-containing protein [Stenomitos frigidus]|uniref:DUF4255 domain-containing protein n=1 Tax=Stenomitos frigidus ULC18 TaxID=2107698 RepID=A0A2T1ENT0_9CYAN|nr:DUF4255 domain-containing protein [Stenomitos frigidus]PSB34407.1 DUF4255 domain-containing protein [Stenomitos frigidus ULC18]
MLYDLDMTLQELLKAELPERFGETSGTQTAITFCTPNRDAIGSKGKFPALNLFLYDIRENQELRSNSWTVTRNENGTATREPPPVRVDCSYLITVWPNDEYDFQVEHKTLGEVMQALLRYPKLPSTVLQGSLQEFQPPSRVSILGQVKLQSLGEFWQAMGGKPKATLNYTLTISVPAPTEPQTLPLVVSSIAFRDGREESNG